MTEVPDDSTEQVIGGYWALDAIITFGGADTGGMYLPSSMFPEIMRRGTSLLIDGLTVKFTRIGGGVIITPIIYSRGGQHFLTKWTMPAVNTDSNHWTPLGIPINTDDIENFIKISLTPAAIDALSVSVWGRFIDPGVETESIPSTERSLLDAIRDLLS